MRSFSFGFVLIVLFNLIWYSGFSQTATVVDNGIEPKHESFSQRVISVFFDDGAGGAITLTGSTPTTDWTVEINGTPVNVTGATILSNRVNVTFDATALNGVSYVLPGQVLTISLNNSGSLQTQGSLIPAANFTTVQSNNNFAFTCSELIFFKQEAYSNVDVCSPVVMDFYQYAYKLSLRFRNSSNFNINDFDFNVIWGDAVITVEAPYLSDQSGIPDGAYFDNTGFTGSNPAVLLTARPIHNYPAANPTDCSFNFSLVPSVNGLICNSISTTTLFATYDNDDANSGALSLVPDVPGTDRVCLGTNVNMIFSDETNLNCRAAIEPILPNDQTRYIRIVYGSSDYDDPGLAGAVNNIPDIRVGGVSVTNNDASGSLIFPTGYFPTGAGGIGVPDFNGVIELASPVTAATATAYMQQITTTLTNNQQAGQRFNVRLDYWDICNTYDPSDPDGNVVSIETYVEIITTPVSPVVTTSPFCESDLDASFELTATGVAGTYDWYKDAGPANNLQTGNDNTFNPVIEGPMADRINKTVAASTVFHRYVTVTTANGCTSLPTDVVIQIDDTNDPGSIGHPLGASPITICSGTDPAAFTNVASASGGDGTPVYQWQSSADNVTYTDIGGATTAIYDPPSIATSTYFRRRVRSGACAEQFSNVIRFIAYQPTGAVSGGGSICQATPAPPVQFTFSGAGPWDMEYAIDGVTQPIVNNILTSPYLINNPAVGVYTIVSLTDVSLSCAAPPGNLTGSATVINSPVNAPTVDSFTVSAAVCDDAGATIPPTATLDLDPAANYDYTYDFNGITHVETNVPTDGTGQIIIAPPYSEWGSAPGSYNISITSLKNTVTGCAGVVPINSLPLIVNARPSVATGALNATACDSPGNGVALSVSDPDPGNALDLEIVWSTTGPALAAFSAVTPADGIVSGANNNTFAPTTSATSTYYAFVQNVSTGCVSTTGLAVTQTQETMPTGGAGPDQPGICIDNPTATMASTSSGGVGSWSVPGIIAYYQNFDGFANATTSSGAANGWSREVSDPQSFTGGQGYFSVQTGRFEADNTNGSLGSGVGNLAEVVWTTPIISISGMSSVQATVDLFDLTNNLDGGGDGDYVRVYYKLDGAGETLFNSNGSFLDDFANSTATAFAAPVTGLNLQIVIRVSTNGSGERIAFDNIIIKDPSSSITFNNPNATNAGVSNLPVPSGAAPVTTTLSWTIVAPLGACRLEDDVNLTVNVLPTSLTITPVLCDDTPGSPVQVTVDLNTYNSSVTDAPTVEWFTDALRTAPFLITGTVNVTNGTTYYWKGTNAAGCSNIGQVTFTIEPLPQAIDQNYEFCEEDATGIDLTTFEADITTGTVDVEWFEDDGSGGLGLAIDDASTPLFNEETDYTITITKTVYARVINTSSTAVPQCFDVAAVVLKYKPRPLDNTISGDDVLCKGSDVTVYQVDPSINMYGTVHTYTWTITGSSVFEVFENGTGFTSTSSYTTTTNDFLIIVKFPNAGSFTITAKETIDGCDGDVSNFNVSVSDIPPALTFSSPDVVVCKNESVTYSLTTTNSSTYSWSVVGGSFSSASSGIGLTTVTITWGTATLPQPKISVQETNASGCAGAAASENITIQDIPVMTQNLDAVVCNDEVSGIVFSTTSSSAAASSYTISAITVEPGLTTTANLNPRTVTDVNEIAGDRFANPTNNPLTVRYTVIPVSSVNCTGASEEIILTVEPAVNATITNSTPSVCSTTSVQISLQSVTQPTAGDISFNYTANASSALVSGFLPVQNNLPNGFNIGDNLTNNDNQPRTLTYSITPVAQNAKLGNGCSGNTVAITVSIEPKPTVVITPNTAAVCEGIPLAFNLSTNTLPSSGNVIFRIAGTPLVTGGVTGASADGTLFNNGDQLADILNNPTTTQQTVTYRLRPEAPGVNCFGDIAQVLVSVNPKPQVTPSATAQSICSGSNVNISLAFDVPNSSGLWTAVSDSQVLGASQGAGSIVFQTLFNNSINAGIVIYSVTPRSPAGCDGNPVNIVITVDPSPDVVITPSTQTVCNGSNTSISLTSSVAGTSFSWNATPSASTIGGAANSSGNTINQTLSNSGVIPGTVLYQVTPTGTMPTACVGVPKSALVTVAPPVDGEFLNSDAAVCKGSLQFLVMGFAGQAPFNIIYSDGLSDITENNVGNIFVKQVSPQSTITYSIKSVKDVNGCNVNLTGESVTITVSEASAAFNVLDPIASCSPHKARLMYDQVAGITYTWRWFDGNPDSVYTATVNSNGKIIQHNFTNPSPTGTTNYYVNLIASVDPSLGGCTDIKKQTVSVYPRVSPNVFPDKTIICSEEIVTFSNQASGASSHRWFYREQGSAGQEMEVRNTINAEYRFLNNTAQNPIVYEVVYRGDNGNCPGEKIIPITVYRGATGAISEGTIPPFTGGETTVNFTNATTPLDGTQFRYEWEFGASSSPPSFAGPDSVIPVTYTSPGTKEIFLRISNIVSEANGMKCVTTVEKSITILLPPLVAGFKIIPFASCFPVNIEVTENISTGDIFKWKVVDRGGNIAATAIAPKPIFHITNPGIYDVFLETSNSITGQQAFVQVEGIEVYDAPTSVFEVRPTNLFVPDTELITFNRSSGANFYEWNFGEGTISNDFEPSHSYALEGKYTITLIAAYDHGQKDIDRDGILDENVVCADTASNVVTARQGGVTRIPNAFTPSANGPSGGNPGSGTFNDVFLPITKGVEEFMMQVYDRWGTLVFESNDKNQGWDGYDRNKNLMPAGVYVYKLTLRLTDGNRTTQIGDVTLIR